MKYLIVLGIFILLIIFMSPSTEGFHNPKKSSTSQVSAGASQYYKWGYNPIKHKKHKKKCPKCETTYIEYDICDPCYSCGRSSCGNYHKKGEKCHKRKDRCYDSDITKNKDIDQYVLKSSVPPCPDMSRYALKSQMPPNIDPSKYILKSEIPPCPDLSNYILKSQISAICKDGHQHLGELHKECPKCPERKVTYERIEEHPDFHKYISKDDCEKYKKSWFDRLEDWLANVFHSGKKYQSASGSPQAFGYSPYVGFSTANPGYGLSGNKVTYTKEGFEGHDDDKELESKEAGRELPSSDVRKSGDYLL